MKEYIRHKIFNVIDIKGLAALEFLDFKGKYRDYIDRHDFWELCYVKKGEIQLTIKKKNITLQQNQIFLIPPNYNHSYNSSDDESEVFVMCFESVSNILKHMMMIKLSLDDNMIDCVEKIIYESQNTFTMNDNDLLEVLKSPNFGGKQAIIIQLEYLLICLTRQLSREQKHEIVFLSDESFYAELVEVVKTFLKENLGMKISLDDICKKMNYSRSFLCKIFKEMTGETIFSYFNNIKIEEAKRMLADTKLSVSNISYSLGFEEVKYFDFFFKKYVGVTPTAFRKGEKKDDNDGKRRNK